MLSDTHCHLDFPDYDKDRLEVIQRARDSGIKLIINVGSDIEHSIAAVSLADEFDFIYACVGIHPHDAKTYSEDTLSQLKELIKKPKVVGMGEIGLDYFRNLSPKDVQIDLFNKILSMARESNLPVVIHSRQAQIDTIKILKDHAQGGLLTGVVHCFSGDELFLKECLELGLNISFTCNITYKKASNLREFVKLCPVEKILLETDSPFLPPEGKRGTRNEPGNVSFLAKAISEIKNIDYEMVNRITFENACRLFSISS